MFKAQAERKWSQAALIVLIASFVIAVALAFADGLIKAYYVEHMRDSPFLTTLSTWTIDFRYVAEQVLIAAAIVFVGAKFVETRTTLSIGFDELNASKISVRGPDEENTVWVSHRYGTKLEAEAISAALNERLIESGSAEESA